MKINALKNTITSGNHNYPIYVAFIKAKDILKISSVPNFSKNDSEEEIAKNIQNEPVKKWQRPLIESKRETITNTFNNQGEFMPNPVLLSENPYKNDSSLTVSPKVINGQTSEMWEINVPYESDQFWIIDGQHRILGLGHDDCKQNLNIIPVVFLLNTNNDYVASDFAKIFAQVTTTATSLNPLHKEWLEYSFKMNKYSNDNWQKSMQTVVELCSNSSFPEGKTHYSNPFYNKIIFNDENKNDTMYLNCQVLTSLINNFYYDRPVKFIHLTPKELSIQLQKAYFQLKKVIQNPENSVFFSDLTNQKHMIMIKAIIKGFLSYISNSCNPQDLNTIPGLNDWNNIFLKLNFDKTDWNWSIHAQSGISWFKDSEKLSTVVLIEAFTNLKIPDNCSDISDCICLGNNAFINFQLKDNSGNTYNHTIQNNRQIIRKPGISNIKITNKSFNSEIISIVDKKTTALYPEYFRMDYSRTKKSGKGIDVPLKRPSTKSRPYDYDSTKRFTLQIKTVLYGGRTDLKEIEFII